MATLREVFDKARVQGKRQVYGSDTLTLGEVIAFILACLVVYPKTATFLKVPEKWRIPLAFGIIFIAMLIW